MLDKIRYWILDIGFFVNNACTPIILIYKMYFFDLNYFLNKLLGYCLGCWTKGILKTHGTGSNDQIMVDLANAPTSI